MEYWEGQMDWELDKGWVCQTCGLNVGLEWGMVHAQCRCNNCHTEYSMRADDELRTVLTIPRCMVVEEYKKPLSLAYTKYQVAVDWMTDEMIDEFMPIPSPTESII